MNYSVAEIVDAVQASDRETQKQFSSYVAKAVNNKRLKRDEAVLLAAERVARVKHLLAAVEIVKLEASTGQLAKIIQFPPARNVSAEAVCHLADTGEKVSADVCQVSANSEKPSEIIEEKVSASNVCQQTESVCQVSAVSASRQTMSTADRAAALVLSAKNRYLYPICRLAIYVAVIATSYRPIEAFFDSLGIFSGRFLAPTAAMIAIAVDLVAMDMWARGIKEICARPRFFKGLALIVTALTFIGGNIAITRGYLTERSGTQTLDAELKDWEQKHSEAKKKAEDKEADFAQKKGTFLSKKWKGAIDPEACETGKMKCSGPFSSLAQIDQGHFIAAGTEMKSAKDALTKLEAEKPKLDESKSDSGVKRRMYVYAAMWAMILAAYVFAPRTETA